MQASPGYTPEEMRRYWRAHARRFQDLDRSRDPEGLTNVCFAGAPLWLNRFAARFQRATFLRLLAHVGGIGGLRALDVGCGVGRWSRLLSEGGARVTGIDLQPETLRANRVRLPACRFVEMSADALAFPASSFELATSVTVLQHIPGAIQGAAMAEIRRVLSPGGCFVMLEGTIDRGADVFSNSPEEWARMAKEAGFRVERIEPYDFAPLVYALKALAGRYAGGRMVPEGLAVEEFHSQFRASPRRGLARVMYRGVLRAATAASYPLEPAIAALAPGRWAHHHGLLLRAV
jgi:SAM-dependent methyltransferase